MSGDAAVHLLQLFAHNGIQVVVDGGWGVDALLGQQTRSHSDLDLALMHTEMPRLRLLLAAHGYRHIPRKGSWQHNIVLGDDRGHEVDLHSYISDVQGNLVAGVTYPLESLTGHGSIQGYAVACIEPEWQVRFHTGYTLDENDYRDVRALSQRFGIALPPEYERFSSRP